MIALMEQQPETTPERLFPAEQYVYTDSNGNVTPKVAALVLSKEAAIKYENAIKGDPHQV